MMLLCGTVGYHLTDSLGVTWLADDLIQLPNAYLLFDSIILKHKTETAYLAFRRQEGPGYANVEPLVFHQSYFHQFYDFAKKSNTFLLHGHFSRPEPVAAFTKIYNEDNLLRVWEKHYSK